MGRTLSFERFFDTIFEDCIEQFVGQSVDKAFIRPRMFASDDQILIRKVLVHTFPDWILHVASE